MGFQTMARQVARRADFNYGREYDTKMIVSGSTLEVYKMSSGQRRGYELSVDATENKKRSFSELSTSEKLDSIKRKKKNLKQKRVDVMRLISTNFYPGLTKFVTLTFRDHVTDRQEAMDEFKKFMKRLNYRQRTKKRPDIKYLGVIEYTKKGRIHFHVVLFNCAYIPKNELAGVWGNGYVKINNIKGMDGSAVARYVTKYMAKQFEEMDEDLSRMLILGQETEKQKDYFTSTNLKRPSVYYMNLGADKLPNLAEQGELVDGKTYKRQKYVGKNEEEELIFVEEEVIYLRFNLKQELKLGQKVAS